MAFGRRRFVHCSLCASGSAAALNLLGCGDDGGAPGVDSGFAGDSGVDSGTEPDTGTADVGIDAGPTCDDAFAGGEMLGVVAFEEQDDAVFHTPQGVGWDGRQLTDLSAVDADSLLTTNENFYIRTRYPDLLVRPDVWTIDVGGLVRTERGITLTDLAPFVEDQGVHVLECSGNYGAGGFGLMSAARWAGASVMDALTLIDVDPAATRVLISGFDDHSVPSRGGHSTPGAAWVFTFEELEQAGAFFATEMNGVPLPKDHGEPIRLYVPGWYGCSCIKWVNEIRFVDESEPATSQMIEFASRTHQSRAHALARDYSPASMDQAAMPVRVEKWRVDGQVRYKVVGIMWGGYRPTADLVFSSGRGDAAPVDVCPVQTQNAIWTVWQHPFIPTATGNHSIRMSIDDDSIVTRRLDTGYYTRVVNIDEV